MEEGRNPSKAIHLRGNQITSLQKSQVHALGVEVPGTERRIVQPRRPNAISAKEKDTMRRFASRRRDSPQSPNMLGDRMLLMQILK
jgi:hypothetical protein